MKWSVANWFRKTLYDANGRRCARVKHTSKGYFAFDMEGRLMVSVRRAKQERHYEIEAWSKALDAQLLLADARKVPWFRAPRADQIRLEWEGIPVALKQLENRDFSIAEGAARGSIQGMLGRKAVIDTTIAGMEWAALLYILAHIMLHEDDLAVV